MLASAISNSDGRRLKSMYAANLMIEPGSNNDLAEGPRQPIYLDSYRGLSRMQDRLGRNISNILGPRGPAHEGYAID
jgi:hypothetical protein